MFNRKSREPDSLDREIERVLSIMAANQPDTDEYVKAANQFERLNKIRRSNNPDKISPDALVAASANLLGIILIVGHERAHVVTSRAVMFLKTLR